ncbi:restriction endonuclease subunit S [Luteipulveratus sp. YIM 133132]|uniref:restriction endonuclease subunit S n=1 Tax=Luteipulveratus flavus TaxID=3031728 RepID=UPI0023B08A2F|nr:restriction endonuclease subunit S [Luteipulveratus sp. YIM 133132]MDE9365327.1 restriction endonuclease subunit S [Luteipulveratus sp. YIM 133132]
MTTLGDLFSVAYGNKLDMNKMVRTERLEGVAFVGRVGGLNGRSGVAGYVEPLSGIDPYPAGLITVALGGSRLLSSYVQQLPFYTAQNVAVLTPQDPSMTLNERLYYAMCIRANAFRYSAFGREANRTLGTLVVPDVPPDWVAAIQIPTHDGLASPAGPAIELSPATSWRSFNVSDIFEVASGKYVPAAQKLPGSTPQVTSSAKSNGVSRYLDLEPNFPGGTISVARNGSVGTAFFQPRPYFATDDVRVWKAKKGPLFETEGLFVCAVTMLEKFRYSYGRKWSIPHMRNTEIRLPADSSGQPDWSYMDSVMRGLPFSAAIASPIVDVRSSEDEHQTAPTL